MIIDIYGLTTFAVLWYNARSAKPAIRIKRNPTYIQACDLTNFSMHLEPRWVDDCASGIIPPGIMHNKHRLADTEAHTARYIAIVYDQRSNIRHCKYWDFTSVRLPEA